MRWVAVVLVIMFGGAFIIDAPTPGSASPPAAPAMRAERFRNVEVDVPNGLPRVTRAYVSDCDGLFRPGVYIAAFESGGSCLINRIDPNLLAVALSPLTADVAGRSPGSDSYRLVKIVKAHDMIVVVWYGRGRRADAEQVLRSVHSV